MTKNKRIFFGKIRAVATLAASACLLASVASCDFLQGSLSSELESKLSAATGTPTVSGSIWYYNGASSTDMSATTGNTLDIEFGQVAALSSEGLSGSFAISYTDTSGNAATVQKSLAGGVFSADCESYYLDMSPVTEMLKSSVVKDGTASVAVKVSGFVCDAGDQKGRSLDAFSKTLSVQPLYSTTTLAGLTFNTMQSTSGASIVIPLKGAVTLASDAAVSVTAAAGSSLPAGINSDNFGLSLSSDGLSILVTPSVELYGQSFTANVYVSGIVPPLSGKAVGQTFPVSFAAAVSSSDTLTLGSQSTVNREITSMSLSDDGTNLTVAFSFDGIPATWENDRLVIMIDDSSLSTGATSYADKGWTNAASYQSVNSSVEFYGYATPKNGPVNMTSSTTWNYNSSTYVYTANSSTVKYTIPLSSIGSGASTGHTLRVVGFFSDYWSSGTTHVIDAVPASAVTVSTTDSSDPADTASVNFDKALSYTVGGVSSNVAVPVPSSPKSFVVGSYTATKVVLNWSYAYNATSYTVYRSTDDSSFTSIAAGLTSTTYTDTSVSPSTKYYYRVSASNASGEGSQSSSISATTKYLAKPSAPTSLTVTSHTSSAVSLSWTASDSATSYSIYRSADGSSYSSLATGITATTYTDSTVSSGTYYYYKVGGVNAAGEGSLSSAAFTYPTITLDGVLDSAEGWTDNVVASTSTDSITWSTTPDISALYVTNDASNLYIAIKFASTPALYNGYRVTILLDNNASTAGGAATTTAAWNAGLATAVTIASGSVEAEITTYATTSGATTSGGSTGSTWTYSSSTYASTPDTSVLEYSIPLSSVGSLTTGNTVYAYTAVSEYTWGSAAQAGVLDHIPASAGTLTYDSTWPNYEADSVSMTSALAYVVK